MKERRGGRAEKSKWILKQRLSASCCCLTERTQSTRSTLRANSLPQEKGEEGKKEEEEGEEEVGEAKSWGGKKERKVRRKEAKGVMWE